MASLAFEQAVSTIVSVKDEIVRILGEAFVMVELSTTVAVIFDTLLDILLFIISSRQLHYDRSVNSLLSNLVNLMRAFPFVVLMVAMTPAICAIVGSTIGPIATSLVLNVSDLFYFTHLVEQNLREVPKGVVEATTTMGASPLTIACKVLLNGARAGMVSSIAVLAIGLLSRSTAAGMIGGGSLGDLAIRYGYYRYQTEVVIFIIAPLVLLVILTQSTSNALVRKLDKHQKPNTEMPSEKYA